MSWLLLALLAFASMFCQDVLGSIMMQAESQFRPHLAASMDTAQDACAITSLLVLGHAALTGGTGTLSATSCAVIAGRLCADYSGTYWGTRLGDRIMHRTRQGRASMTEPGTAPGKGAAQRLADFANWFNETVVGSPWTYLVCILTVVGVYLVCIFQGYEKWNLTTGLFFNTASSSIELITGVGAVVGVYAVRRGQKQHRQDVRDLHRKVDALKGDAEDDGGR